MLSLPPEIYAVLCEQVDTASLALFCRISRAFQEQAQWILYHKVDLRACSLPYVKSWCMAITRRTHLAERVSSLSLRLPNSLNQEDAERLGRAFAACVNLLRFAVSHIPGGLMSDICPQTWMIDECGFRLERFSNTYFNLNRGMETFFERQTGIRVLSLPSAMHQFPFADDHLPSLSAIDASLEIVLGLPAGRALQRVQIHGERSGYFGSLASLSRYSATLKSLTLVRGAGTGSGFQIADIVRSVALALPELKHLGINERISLAETRPQHTLLTTLALTDCPISSLGMFKSLETLTYRIRHRTHFFGMSEDCHFSVDTREGLLAFGKAVLKACGSSLRRAAIGIGADLGPGLKCVFTRDREGLVIDEFVEELDFDDGFWSWRRRRWLSSAVTAGITLITLSSTMASFLSLPPEICSIICDQVDTSLAPLCRISPSFREQAQRIMYRTVDLQDCNIRLVKSWCLAVTRRSPLAERVRSLFLELPVALEPEEAEKLSRSLALCVNLKHLSVFHVPGLPSDLSIQTWMIEECAFRLEHFSNSYFALNSGIDTFFDNQTGVRVLSLPSPRDSEYLSFDDRLKNLVAIDAPLDIVLDIPDGRPLERIQLHYDRSEYVVGLAELSRFASTLTTLTVVREGEDWGSSITAIIHEIAHALPDLQHLGINEKERLLTFFALEETPSHVLKLFTRLETLSLRIRRGVCFAGVARTYGVTNTADLEAFGRDILTGCSTLRKVAIGSEPLKDKSFYCTLSKQENGNVESSGDEPDFDDEFWI